jgi:hypothetical protein
MVLKRTYGRLTRGIFNKSSFFLFLQLAFVRDQDGVEGRVGGVDSTAWRLSRFITSYSLLFFLFKTDFVTGHCICQR